MKRRVLWANGINLDGLYSKTPMECVRSINHDMGVDYWSKGGNFSVPGPGLFTNEGRFTKSGHIEFADTNKNNVECWTQGVKDTMRMLARWCQ